MRVDVTYVFDRGFVRPSVISAYSLLSHRTGAARLRFLLTEPVPELAGMAERLGSLFPACEIEVRVERDLDQGQPVRGHVSRAALARLRLPAILDEPTLYLDGDTLVRRDVGQLFALDRQGHPVLAVRDAGIARALRYRERGGWVPPKARRHLRDLDRIAHLVDLGTYVNSGVMLFDLPAIRAAGLDRAMADVDAAVRMRQEYDLRFNDQNWLNHVFRGRIALADAGWNALWGNRFTGKAPFSPTERADYAASRTDPAIVHFTGRLRPWEVRHVWAHPKRRPWLAEYKAVQASAEAALGLTAMDARPGT